MIDAPSRPVIMEDRCINLLHNMRKSPSGTLFGKYLRNAVVDFLDLVVVWEKDASNRGR